MKAILLAAGKGTRISKLVKAVPKCTLPIDGEPLIKRTVKILLEKGIECVVCVGYQKERIMEALKDYSVIYYYNPFFDVTNSIATLWFAKDELGNDDILLFNADVYFTKEILHNLLRDSRDAVMVVDRTRTQTGDYFFSTTDNGTINKYGKELPLQFRSCEYVGMAKVMLPLLGDFCKRLEYLIHHQQHQMWWENVLYSFTDKDEHKIYTMDVNNLFWSEIDYFDDYERILNYVACRRGE